MIKKKASVICNRPKPLEKPFTFDISKDVQLRIYPDNRPRNMEIAALQKGLVLVANGLELIEEGAGFGVPIVKYSDATYFSRTATVYIREQNENAVTITKVFSLDSVSRKVVHGAVIDDDIYSVLHKTFEKAYLHYGKLRSFFDWMMELRRIIGIETRFDKVLPRGKVTVNYHCCPDNIKVYADFSEVERKRCREILILNEQGATFFRNSRLNGNAVLQKRKIGPWTRVDAEKAEFFYIEKGISFSLENRDGAVMYCGWEQIRDKLSWAGITCALNPRTLVFSYNIRLLENQT